MAERARSFTSLSTSEAAVEGLLRGIAAGIAMLAFLLVTGLVMGDPERQTILAAGGELAASPVTSLFAHLAVASFYGLLWGPAWRWISRHSALPAWMAGMAYGIVLFVLAQSLAQALPLPLQQLSSGVMLAAHSFYGFVLGALSR
jgi:hypothetical protein